MGRGALLILCLPIMFTACLRHVATRPSLIANLPQTLESRELTSTSDAGITRRLQKKLGITEVFWILEKAAGAVSTYSKANAVKLALEETGEVVEDAAETAERMEEKLQRAHDYFMKTGLEAFMQRIEEDNIDAFAKTDFPDALVEVESSADDLDELLGISRAVITILKSVRSIAVDTNSLNDSLLNVDVDFYLTPLEEHVSKAVLQVKHSLSAIKTQCDETKESFKRFLRYDLAKGKEHAKHGAQAIFAYQSILISNFNEIYTWMVKPLILELVKAVRAIYEAAQQLTRSLDSPESVADEVTDRSSCSWRQTRWFKSVEDYKVDIGKTMVCNTVKTLGKRFKCRCIGTNDCYVANKFRPGDKDSRRCFQKV